MTEASIPRIETGGEEAWSVFTGTYDRTGSPVTQEGLDAVERELQAVRTRLGYNEEIMSRYRQVETLVYLAGLCDQRLIDDPSAKDRAYKDFAKGAMLLSSGYDIGELRRYADIELSHLDSRPIPTLSAIEDIKARGLMDPSSAELLGVAARLSAISELGGKLPPVRRQV